MIPGHSSVPVHRSILAVDIEQSSWTDGPIRAELREHTYRLLREAMTYAGVEPATAILSPIAATASWC